MTAAANADAQLSTAASNADEASVFDLEAVPGNDARAQAIYFRIYSQYVEIVYPECHFTQYPQCGPACW